MRKAPPILPSLWFALAYLALSGVGAGAAPEAGAYQIIVHPSHGIAEVPRGFLADAFLKKVTRWPDDSVIRPADLAATAPARTGFSTDVLRRSLEAVKAYWQRRIFAGQAVPPPEFARDADVISYVLQHPNAIGYISATTDARGVRVVRVTP